MFKIIAVTNRNLCKINFLDQIENVAKAKPNHIILREKDLSEEDYYILASKVKAICQTYQVPCILHTYIDVARKLEQTSIHLPLPLLIRKKHQLSDFQTIGVSVHSVEEARLAEELGATYLTAGHIFETNCKKGVSPRGISFLKDVIQHTNIPVYAIGGIHLENLTYIQNAGAHGACMMSEFMQENRTKDLQKDLHSLQKK